MQVNAGTLAATAQTYRVLFLESFDAYTPYWTNVASLVEANALSIDHRGMGRPPSIEEWVDEKQLEGLIGASYLLSMKEWASGIEVYRPHIETDQLGLYNASIKDLGMRAKQHPDKLVSLVRVAGAVGKGYDGFAFYAANHVFGKSGVFSNKLAGSGTTLAQVTTDFNAARAAMRKFLDDKGEPMNDDEPKLAVDCSPDLEAVFKILLNAQMIPSATGPLSNTLLGAAQLHVNNRLTGNSWYLDEIGSARKPFIYQVRKQAQFVDLIAPTSEAVFSKQKFAFSMEASYNVGYGVPQKSIMINQ